jgi:hypothetical protein
VHAIIIIKKFSIGKENFLLASDIRAKTLNKKFFAMMTSCKTSA